MYIWLLLLAADAAAVAIAIQALRAKDRAALGELARWARFCAWAGFVGVLLVAASTAWRALQSYRAVLATVTEPSVHAGARRIVIAEGMYVVLIALLLLVPPLVTRAAVVRRAAQPAI